MVDLPVSARIQNRLTGYLYALLYALSDTLLLGASLLGWITVALLAAGLYIWLQTSAVIWLFIFMAIALLVRIGHWIAKRSGFIVFSEQKSVKPPQNTGAISDYQKFDLWASGIFSIIGREEYMFQRPTKLWRVPFGDHALMVERPSGRFLYQFIEKGFIKTLRPGYLVYGPRVNPALEIIFRTTWGPSEGETEYKWYAPSKGSQPKRLRRTLYLGFETHTDRDAIWDSLQQS